MIKMFFENGHFWGPAAPLNTESTPTLGAGMSPVGWSLVKRPIAERVDRWTGCWSICIVHLNIRRRERQKKFHVCFFKVFFRIPFPNSFSEFIFQNSFSEFIFPLYMTRCKDVINWSFTPFFTPSIRVVYATFVMHKTIVYKQKYASWTSKTMKYPLEKS